METNGIIQLYPLLRLAFWLIVGMFTGEWLTELFHPWWWLCGCGALLLLACVVHYYRRPVCESILLSVSVSLLGAFLLSDAEAVAHAELPDSDVTYDAVVMSEPQVHGKVIQCDLLLVGGDESMKVKAAILCDTVENRWQRLHVGDGIHAESVLEAPKNYGNTDFDYARWLVVHGYRAQTFIYYNVWRKAEVDLSALSVVQRARLWALVFRQQIVEHYRLHGMSGREHAVIAAMTLGDKSLLDKELKDVYSVSGASHVLALSGLHLGIIYGLLVMLLPLGRHRRWLVHFLAVVTIWVYAVMVGLSSSVVRSALMLSVCALVDVLGRDRQSLNTLSLAAIIMLVWQPLTLFDVGFQLSFFAVFSILLYSRPLSSLLPSGFTRRFPVIRRLWSMLAVSFAAQLATAPLVAYYFGRFSCYTLLTTLFVIPLAVVILYGSVFFFLSSPVTSLQFFVAKLLLWVVALTNSILSWVASLPFASIEGLHPSALQVFLIYVLIAAISGLLYQFSKLRNLRAIHD